MLLRIYASLLGKEHMNKTIILALVFAVLAAFFAYMFLSDIQTKYRTMAEPVQVVVANQRIAQGTVIKREMLAEKMIPKEYAQPKVFAGINNLFTKEGSSVYIALNAIEPDEQILSTKVSRINQDTGISNIIPDGRKAIAVNFDSDSSSIIAPGSRIDILSIIEYADSNKQMQQSVFMIAQNILVLASGPDYLGAPKKKKDEESGSGRSGIITLSVTVQEAQTILIAAERGTLKYIIRPAGDNEIYDVKPFKISDIVKDISKTAPAQPPSTADPKVAKAISQNQKEAMELINKYANSQK